MKHLKLNNPIYGTQFKNVYVSTHGNDDNDIKAIDNQNYPLKTISKALAVSNIIDEIYDVKILLLDGVYYIEEPIVVENYTRNISIESLNERKAQIKGTKIVERNIIQKYSEDILKFPVDDFVYTLSVNSESSETDVRYISKYIPTSTPFEFQNGYEFSDYCNREYYLTGASAYKDPIILTLTNDSSNLELSTITYPDCYEVIENKEEGTYTYIVTDANGNVAKSAPGQINIHLEFSRNVRTKYNKVRISEEIYNVAYKGAIYASYTAWFTTKSFIIDKYQDESNYYLILDRDPKEYYGQDSKEYKVNIWNRIEDLVPGSYCCKLEEDGKYYCYYKLLEGESSTNIIISVGNLTQLLNVKNTSHITFKNICIGFSNPKNFDVSFGQAEEASEGKIIVDNCYDVNFDGCLFEGTWDYTFDITNNSTKCTISNSVFVNIYGGAIIGSGDSSLCIFNNNVIKKYGRQEEAVAAMLLYKCHKWIITYNDICDGYYSGISTGWGWSGDVVYSSNLYIAYNHIHHLFQGLFTDGAGIYNLGKTNGMLIEYNRIHDIVGYSLDYSCGCIYYDSGSTNVIVRYNILYASVILTLTSGIGHYTYNNIFAYPIRAITAVSDKQNSLGITYKNNIFLHGAQSLLSKYYTEASAGFISNLEISNKNEIGNYDSPIITNNYHTNMNPFNNSLLEDFSISQSSAYSLYNDCGFILSNMYPNAQINVFNFEVWWRFKDFTQGVSEDMWYYAKKDLTDEEKSRLKTMYKNKFGDIGEYWSS